MHYKYKYKINIKHYFIYFIYYLFIINNDIREKSHIMKPKIILYLL